MQEKFIGIAADVNSTTLFLGMSANCFVFGFETYPGCFTLRFGPVVFMVDWS